MTEYEKFIESKQLSDAPTGLVRSKPMNEKLFDFQSACVDWALSRGRAALFQDCGLGKTGQSLEWCDHIDGRKIIVTPLAVSSQFVREGAKFNIDGVKYLREDDDVTPIVITNYEMIQNFDPRKFNGIVVDEAGIMKSYTGKYRNEFVNRWSNVPFRLSATATPAPNDFMELGNQSEFLGSMTRTDMLSTFFVHDAGETQKWRVKGHAEDAFWRWVASWAVMIKKPSDIGFDDGDFNLPEYTLNQVVVDSNKPLDGMLLEMPASTLQERQQARRNSVNERVEVVAHLANSTTDPFIAWCDLNPESDALKKAIPDAVEVRGSDSRESKEEKLMGFVDRKYRVLVSKPSIAGWGMNFQHCHRMAFTGLSDSYEQFYQAFRRCWRFGQTRNVIADIVISGNEGAVLANIKRKEKQAQEMSDMMVEKMRIVMNENMHGMTRLSKKYVATETIQKPSWI